MQNFITILEDQNQMLSHFNEKVMNLRDSLNTRKEDDWS